MAGGEHKSSPELLGMLYRLIWLKCRVMKRLMLFYRCQSLLVSYQYRSLSWLYSVSWWTGSIKGLLIVFEDLN